MSHGADPRIELRPGLAAILGLVGFLLVGLADYFSGVEVRAYPLYFLPLSITAWHFGRIGACIAAVTATTIWILSNWAAGLQYSTGNVWIINTLSQAAAFGTVAALLSWARTLLDREQELSRSDSLTGLENARAFRASLELAVASCRRKQKPLTLAYIDLDNFKSVNDRYGHYRGDALLRDVASVLQRGIRATDSAARIGGDEFVVCLPESHELQARSVLERLREALAGVIQTDECMISASIGAFCWELPPEDIDMMISSADQLMYTVKKSGKNRLEIVSMMTHQGDDSSPNHQRQALNH